MTQVDLLLAEPDGYVARLLSCGWRDGWRRTDGAGRGCAVAAGRAARWREVYRRRRAPGLQRHPPATAAICRPARRLGPERRLLAAGGAGGRRRRARGVLYLAHDRPAASATTTWPSQIVARARRRPDRGGGPAPAPGCAGAGRGRGAGPAGVRRHRLARAEDAGRGHPGLHRPAAAPGGAQRRATPTSTWCGASPTGRADAGPDRADARPAAAGGGAVRARAQPIRPGRRGSAHRRGTQATTTHVSRTSC